MQIDLLTLEKQQKQLAKQVIVQGNKLYQVQKSDLMLAFDIQYKNEIAYIAGHLFEYPDKEIKNFVGTFAIEMPYIPRFFCFREGPPLLALYQEIINSTHFKPKVLIIDGHGLAHPQKLGVASWLGLKTNIVSIGCAKSTLLPYQGNLLEEKGSVLRLKIAEETLGYVLRRKTGINPIFVSAGHLIDLEMSKEIILNLGGDYKIPDCLRIADHLARKYANNDLESETNIINFTSLN